VSCIAVLYYVIYTITNSSLHSVSPLIHEMVRIGITLQGQQLCTMIEDTLTTIAHRCNAIVSYVKWRMQQPNLSVVDLRKSMYEMFL